jgi:hypothetical protein
MIETEAALARRKEIITENEADILTRNNQHNNATTKDFYLKLAATDTAEYARAAYNHMYASDDEDDLFEHTPRKRAKRVEWSTEERNALLSWVKDFEIKNGQDARKPWNQCVASLMSNSAFSPCHLTKSALRDAWKRYREYDTIAMYSLK